MRVSYLCTVKKFRIIRPDAGNTFSEALSSLLAQMGEFFRTEAAEGRNPVFIRFFLSDAQNQGAVLRAALEAEVGPLLPSLAVSVVEQPPLDGSRITALVQTSSRELPCLFHSLRLTEDEAAGKTPTPSPASCLKNTWTSSVRSGSNSRRTACGPGSTCVTLIPTIWDS